MITKTLAGLFIALSLTTPAIAMTTIAPPPEVETEKAVSDQGLKTSSDDKRQDERGHRHDQAKAKDQAGPNKKD